MAAIAAAGIGLVGGLASASLSKGGGGSVPFKPVNVNAGGLNTIFDEKSNTVSVLPGKSKRIAELDAQILALKAQLRAADDTRGPFRADPGGDGSQNAPNGLTPGARSEIEKQIRQLESQKNSVKAEPDFRQSLVQKQSDLFNLQAQEIAGLRAQIIPGFGRLTQATTDAFGQTRERLGNSRRVTVGNLKENLARRQVLGSSFADDSLIRAGLKFDLRDRELATQETLAKSQAFLGEYGLTLDNIDRTNVALQEAAGVLIDEQNFHTNLAVQLTTGIQSQLGENARLKARLAAESAAGVGAFVGDLTESFRGQIEKNNTPAPVTTVAPTSTPIQTDAAGRIIGGI